MVLLEGPSFICNLNNEKLRGRFGASIINKIFRLKLIIFLKISSNFCYFLEIDKIEIGFLGSQATKANLFKITRPTSNLTLKN